jgi:hypothetical protein
MFARLIPTFQLPALFRFFRDSSFLTDVIERAVGSFWWDSRICRTRIWEKLLLGYGTPESEDPHLAKATPPLWGCPPTPGRRAICKKPRSRSRGLSKLTGATGLLW